MSLKDLADKLKSAGGRLGKRAAKGAAKTALHVTAGAARGALDAMGDAIEEAVFGKKEKPKSGDAAPERDPFAKLKAKERAKKDEE